MGRITMKSGMGVIGMAPELKLQPFCIPKGLRKIFDNKMKRFPNMKSNEEMYLPMLNKVLNKEDIEPNSYVNYFKFLLYLEDYQRELEMKMYDLKNQTIKRCGEGVEFMVHVPGLSEERPSLKLYDEVRLCKTDGSMNCNTAVSYVGQDFVKIVAHLTFSKNFKENDLYDVKFLLPRRTIQCCHYAVELVHTNNLALALFPTVKCSYNSLSKELRWFNKNIRNNPEQKQAIGNIVAKTAHPAPYVLFGPPGTGKTATLVEAITQIWALQPCSHVLICAPSNAAADELLKRLLQNIPHQDIHRIYGLSRNWDEVDKKIQPCSNFADGELIFLPKELIMLRRIVVTTLMSCARLLALKLRESHFSYVFIDEAGQATEPESLIPLGLMCSDDPFHIGRLQGQLVIAGDPKQLGPSIAQQSVDALGKSMLERLMEQCKPYQKDETGKYNPNYITKLVQNFRSHKSVLHVPNQLFYAGDLIACGKAKEINRAINCAALPNKSFPLIFHAVRGKEIREKYSPSIANLDEVKIVMKYVESLMGTKLGGRKLQQKDIGIITPYKLQRAKIHHELENRNWQNISVGTVEVFQGQERDVIIISTVRSCIYEYNGKLHLGFLSNPKRFNVAITRAKCLLITIGHPEILQVDDCWTNLINYCKQHNACVGNNFSIPNTLSNKDKRKLLAKKYMPPKAVATNFHFPEDQSSVVQNFENCVIPENAVPKRRRRMPKLNKQLVTPLPTLEFATDSSITSTSMSNSTTDLEQQDSFSNISSTDRYTSPSKNGTSSTGNESDESSLSEEYENTGTANPTSFFCKNLMQSLEQINSSNKDTSRFDDSKEFADSGDDVDSYYLTLSNKLALLYEI